MEDGPKLLPQWLRNSSSNLHHRGNGTSPSAAAKPSADFGRGPDRVGSAQESRPSWKSRESGFPAAGARPSYAPGALRPGGRDSRDQVSLKPGGGYGVGRPYGRPGDLDGGGGSPAVGSSGGGGGGGGGGARLDRAQDSWPPARPLSGLGRAIGDEDRRSPLRGQPDSGGQAATAAQTKASFDKDFPSLRPGAVGGSSGSPGPTTPAASGSALLATSLSSPLLEPLTTDTGGSSLAAPYRQTFLSARTTSNWTSKLAEAPAVVPAEAAVVTVAEAPPPSAPAIAEDAPLQPPAATPASQSPSLSPVKAAPAAPAPAVPPRPAGVWGAAAAAVVGSAAAPASPFTPAGDVSAVHGDNGAVVATIAAPGAGADVGAVDNCGKAPTGQSELPLRRSSGHPALLVTAEEEAFLRSLGWTGFEEEEGGEEEAGLTEEEIAAFRAMQEQQQRHQQLQQAAATGAGKASPPAARWGDGAPVAAGGALGVRVAAAAAPKPVPCGGAAACRRGKPLIVAASYGSEQISSSSDSECD
ncbi:hypothetical protein GPECTOR_41g674 [Gonium pectorale]|uniref:Uncharacterized protein n=1 Tax=Gonium pectorale TaxID=33097 RepID=A0A150GBH2_GONPE|nr:hypothetical protein GPECTOR_41g674 [Gonium pectorale]|eukprot:KXZ46710.1 hypothetical protein GPECTOR_41g674 [Gonium pectorale]